MKIDSQNSSIQLGAFLKQIHNQQSVSESKSQSTSSKVTSFDKVQLSERALEVQQAQQMLRETPDVQTDKVEQVRSAVNNGIYHIPGVTVAKDMILESFENEKILRNIDTMV